MESLPEPMHSENLGELLTALAKAQSTIANAAKDKDNPFFSKSYADLPSVWKACREPLTSNGLSVIQTTCGSKSEPYLMTWLGHSSGQWIRSKLPLFMVKSDPQALGSALTYARRYALSAIVGVCADDDDGEAAMGRTSDNKATPDLFSEFVGQEAELEKYIAEVQAHYKWDRSKAVAEMSKDVAKTKKTFEKRLKAKAGDNA